MRLRELRDQNMRVRRVLTKYKQRSDKYLRGKCYRDLCDLAGMVLLALGEDDTPGEDDYEGNGDGMKGFLAALRVMDLEGCNSRLNRKKINEAYRKSLEYLPEIRNATII